jgi:hypothetical protein
MKIPVKNSKLVRDTKTGAILSTDIIAIKEYEEKKRRKEIEKNRLNRLELEVSELRSVIDELRKRQ